MTRVYGNKVKNTSGGYTRTWRLYADYSVSSTETNYTIKGTSLGVQNTASQSGATMGFNANSLTVSYSGVLSASYTRTTKTGDIKGGATFQIYGTDKSAVIERTRVAQSKSLTFKCVANSKTAWKGTSTKTVSLTIPARSSHTVSYDANGGSGSIPSFTKFYSATGETAYYETLSDGSGFTKPYHRIVGWNTMPDGSGISYPLSGNYTANGTAAVTLYAQWEKIPATITFNANGGSGTVPSAISTYVGVANTIPSNSLTRTGYTFNGWNTASDGSGTAYATGSTITPTGNVTLYAQWEKTTPTIRVKINDSIVTGLFYIKANNAIHLVSEAYVKVNGVWKQIE